MIRCSGFFDRGLVAGSNAMNKLPQLGKQDRVSATSQITGAVEGGVVIRAHCGMRGGVFFLFLFLYVHATSTICPCGQFFIDIGI